MYKILGYTLYWFIFSWNTLSINALKLIKELEFEPQSLKTYDKGFKAVTKITFNTTQHVQCSKIVYTMMIY